MLEPLHNVLHCNMISDMKCLDPSHPTRSPSLEPVESDTELIITVPVLYLINIPLIARGSCVIHDAVHIIVNSENLKGYLKAKCRAPVYSRVLRRVRWVV